jgi:NAD(P) transhydrogenase subunit alpha
MRKGSVIVDMAAATGGNCPLTRADEVIVEHGVTLVGHTNYPAMMPSDASLFYAKNIANLLDLIVVKGDDGLIFSDFEDDDITRETLLTPETSICII